MPDQPNILLIHTHDMGRYVGCYGAPIDTPQIDSLAADGVRFANHYTTAPQCSPSRASLFTGNYPSTHGSIGLTHPRSIYNYLWENIFLFSGLPGLWNRPEYGVPETI